MSTEKGDPMRYSCSYSTLLGPICITQEDSAIIRISLQNEKIPEDSTKAETELLQLAFRQLAEYLDGKRKVFDLPLMFSGTPFQQQIWKQLQQIPYGATVSYKDIAAAIGNPKATRAVGQANHRNPIAIVVPCHRVISADGSLGGYGGGLPMKRFLLDLEKRFA
jgi:methylated-DNA-[protein]-cysteine S-methyltransferase